MQLPTIEPICSNFPDVSEWLDSFIDCTERLLVPRNVAESDMIKIRR